MIWWEEMADRSGTRFDAEHLEGDVGGRPMRGIHVTNSSGINFIAILSLQRHSVNPGLAVVLVMAVEYGVCIWHCMASHHLRGRNLYDSHDFILLYNGMMMMAGPFEVSSGQRFDWGAGTEDGVQELSHGFP